MPDFGWELPPGVHYGQREAEFDFVCTSDRCPHLLEQGYAWQGTYEWAELETVGDMAYATREVEDKDRHRWTVGGYVETDTGAGVLGDEDPECPLCGGEGRNV